MLSPCDNERRTPSSGPTRSGADGDIVGPVPPVVLIHGLGRTSASLRRLARSLAARGHATLSVDYPSRRCDLRTCASRLRDQVLDFQDRAGRDLAFVGHSMGGLVARFLAADPEVTARAIVMIAPPNQGSEVADFVHGFRIGRLMLGPALKDLRTTGAGFIPRPECPIGVIAGTRSYLPLASKLVSGVHDGLVSLDRSRLEGSDWIALDGGHTCLMNHPGAIEATAAFLRDSRFPAHLRS